jgi:cyclin B
MYRKRKADVSPLKNERIKRCALTNLTNNNVAKNDEESTNKKLTIAKEVDNVPSIIQPIGYRTRAAAAATNQHQQQRNLIKGTNNNNTKTKAKNVIISENHVPEKSKNNALVATLKSKKSIEAPGKPSIASRRISNEFERTEESLYVSALEDISSDLSRLSDTRAKIGKIVEAKSSSSSVSSNCNSQVTSGSSSASSLSSKASLDLSTTLSSSDNEDIFEDAVNRRLPSGVVHFDKENWNDHFQVSHYAMDIFEYLQLREEKYQIKDYISLQPELSKWMRSLLVDWMVEVQESFELNHETLYLAIKIVDTYLGKEQVSKDSLQLLGAAALLIACKYDVSVCPP